METETDTPKVYTVVANLSKIFTNTVDILLQEVIQDETGVVQVVASDHINLNLSGGFTPNHLSRLLHEKQVPESQYLGQKIALDINRELANDDSLREPAFVFVTVDFIRETRLILPPDEPTPSRGASREVLQRLADQQRVLEVKKNEIHCSICIEDLSKNHQKIIEMPKCLHRFHQDCLFEWLGRQNSCPLCRSVPYGLDQETES
ncbi:unnamed protein product [Eruca vesicaria subsp. sativa]|uniref:RING-type domain-containing protein n=1 Tax=Eruca vesicaria subsp. sativa TaxID=29727 RepID=A0ABC8LVE3_ERUVS|nr:unnamed protein product [Eruca vesicaria subsp. sativa]